MARALCLLLLLAAVPAAAQITVPVPGRPNASYVVYDTVLSANFVQVHVLFSDSVADEHEVWMFECTDGWATLLHREPGAPSRFPLPYPPRSDERLRSDTTIYSIGLVSCQSHGFDTSAWGA
jgi:hypothetical protein